MKANLEFAYPAIIELVFAIPFGAVRIQAALIFSQIDAHSCVVSFRFGPGDNAMNWPEGIHAATLKLVTRYDRKSPYGLFARESLYRSVLLRKDGKHLPEICIAPSELFAAVALYLAIDRVSACPVELEVGFNDESP